MHTPTDPTPATRPRSTAPTAYTGYSFHLIEAVIVFANEILVCLLFPIHMGVHRVYHMFTTVIHNGGHAGYEIAPFIPSIEQLAVCLVHGAKARPQTTTACCGWPVFRCPPPPCPAVCQGAQHGQAPRHAPPVPALPLQPVFHPLGPLVRDPASKIRRDSPRGRGQAGGTGGGCRAAGGGNPSTACCSRGNTEKVSPLGSRQIDRLDVM